MGASGTHLNVAPQGETMTEIIAAVLRETGGPFTIEKGTLEAPRADEILVRVLGVGLCHTDLVARDQVIPIPFPAVLGHEGSGIVEAVGANVRKVVPGDKVVLTFRSCGECPTCLRGEPAYCHQFPILNFAGVRPDGSHPISIGGAAASGNFFGQSSFASHALAYERNVVKVAADAPIELLGPLGCGLQTGAGAIMRSLACRAGSSVLVMGTGAVGLSAIMAAKVQGCTTIIASDPMAERRRLALELGATHAIDPRAGDLATAVREILPLGVDYALDTSGLPAVIEGALGCMAPRGSLGLVGVPPAVDATFATLLIAFISLGLSVHGIIEGDSDPDVLIPELVRLHAEGRFPLERLVKVYPMAEINQAVADQHHGVCVKVVLKP